MKLIPSPLAQSFHSPADPYGSRSADLLLRSGTDRHWPVGWLARRAAQAQSASQHDWDEYASAALDALLVASFSADLGGGGAALRYGEFARSAGATEPSSVEQFICPRTYVLTQQIKERSAKALPVVCEPIGRARIRDEMLDCLYRSLPSDVALLAVGATVFGLMGHIDTSRGTYFAIIIAAAVGNGELSPSNDEVNVREYLSTPMLAAWDLPDEFFGLLRRLELLAGGTYEQFLFRRPAHAIDDASAADAVCALMMQSPIVDEFVRNELAQRICARCIDDAEASLKALSEAGG